MEDVFRALADPSRRLLLDCLFARDGQTLLELQQHLTTMTRHGVMKHLGVLEAAGLVTTRRAGRLKLHYLNPVPIRLVHDRWITKFAAPVAAAMAGLKTHLEGTMTFRPRHVFEVNIRATPERVWECMTDAALTRRWNHGLAIESDLVVGGPLRYVMPDGTVATEAVIEHLEPGRGWVLRVHHPFHPALAGEAPYRQTMEIDRVSPTVSKVTIILDDLDDGSATDTLLRDGTRALLDSFKSLVETGEALSLTP